MGIVALLREQQTNYYENLSSGLRKKNLTSIKFQKFFLTWMEEHKSGGHLLYVSKPLVALASSFTQNAGPPLFHQWCD